MRDFRNFPELELRFPPDGVAIVGDNGSGKTNLLEGLYYLEIFRSFRGAADEELVRFGGEAFHVRGRFEDPGGGPGVEVAVGFERRSRRKRVEVDGAEEPRLGDAVGRVGMVVFAPSDVELVTGSPGARRRYLDILLCVNRPRYLDALQRYRQVLRHRNEVLRDGHGRQHLEAWSDALVESGARLVTERAAWVRERGRSFARFHAAVGDGVEGRMTYASSVPLESEEMTGDPAAIAGSFRAELERLRERERDRRMTLVGPHRDDLILEAVRPDGAIELRRFGSGGQQRTAAVALRLAEAETIRRARGREPIVMLDDIMAELDPGRSRRLLELMEAEERGQVILTAPKSSDVEIRGGALARWRIAGGRVEA